MSDIPKLRICHIVVQNNPGVIVCAQNIIDIDHDSDAEEYVSGTSGSGDDNDNENDAVDAEVGEHASDMVVPNREVQLVRIDIEEEE